MKKLISITLCIMMLLSLCACGAENEILVGSGDPDTVATIEWSAYDELILKIAVESDSEKRSLMLHQAEDMLMDTGTIVPISYSNDYALIKPYISGAYVEPQGLIHLMGAKNSNAALGEPLRACICQEVANLDQTDVATVDLSQIHANISSFLLQYDKNGDLYCDLAESYSVSDDLCTYTFVLRDNLRWSDGTSLTAEDFVYSWKRLAATETGAESGYFLESIEGYPDNLNITASEDGKVFTVKLSSPCPYFLALCAYTALAPVPKAQVEAAEGYLDATGKIFNPHAFGNASSMVTSGPFFVERWNHNESLILRKNPYYYDADNVIPEKVELMLSGDATSMYSAYVSGAISVLHGGVPADMMPEVMKLPDYVAIYPLSNRYLSFNAKSDLFKGMTADEAITFRKALSYVIDRQFISDIASSSHAPVATTFVPKNIHDATGRTFGECCDGYEYPAGDGYYDPKQDLSKAREMLKSIGYEFNDDGKLKYPITIEFAYSSGEAAELLAACLQADFAQIGINLTLSGKEWAVFLGERQSGLCELTLDGWSADYDDAYNFLAIYTSHSANNDVFLGK